MAKPSVRRTPKGLSAKQRSVVAAAAARIFPTTDTPGALEAGADYYIDEALAGPYARDKRLYQKGCAALDRRARDRYGRAFDKLTPRQCDALLREFERGKVANFPQASQFFMALWRHTMEGVFGEPAYGGNRDMVGWQLVGFPGQRAGYAKTPRGQPIDLPPETLASGAFDPSEQLGEQFK